MSAGGFTNRFWKMLGGGGRGSSSPGEGGTLEDTAVQKTRRNTTDGAKREPGIDDQGTANIPLKPTLDHIPVKELSAASETFDFDTLLVNEWGCEPGLSLTDWDDPAADTGNHAAVKRTDHGSGTLSNASEEALKLIASNQRTQPSTLCWLALHDSPSVRSTVALNKNILLETVWLLARDYNEAVRLAVADNQKSDRAVLYALIKDESALVARSAQNTLNLIEQAVAKQLPAAESITVNEVEGTINQEKLISQQQSDHTESPIEVEFLQLVARKPSTPARRLSELANHPNENIRASVAENANTPLETLRVLLRDQSVEVKVRLADNYNCPLEIIEQLKNDKDNYVVWRARTVLSRINGDSADEVLSGNDKTRRSPKVALSQ